MMASAELMMVDFEGDSDACKLKKSGSNKHLAFFSAAVRSGKKNAVCGGGSRSGGKDMRRRANDSRVFSKAGTGPKSIRAHRTDGRGSGLIKAGLSGELEPQVIIPNLVGRRKYDKTIVSSRQARSVPARIGGGKQKEEILLGTEAMIGRGILRLSQPMERGIVKDSADMEELWASIFDKLKIGADESPVLVSESPFCPRQDREHLAQYFFDKLRVPALTFCVQGVLALYAARRTTGVVLDCGDSLTQCVPVYEGFALPNAVTCVDLAGRDVTEHLMMLLRKSGHAFHTTAERQIAREIKEQLCYVAQSPTVEERAVSGATYTLPDGLKTFISGDLSATYTLPDGLEISLSAERFRAPEILFRPGLIGSECMGVHELVADSISRCEMDMKTTLYSEIVLAGGSSQFPGFDDRLLHSLQNICSSDTKVKIFSPPGRQNLSWVGGSILASLNTFSSLLITKQEYDQDPTAVHRYSL